MRKAALVNRVIGYRQAISNASHVTLYVLFIITMPFIIHRRPPYRVYVEEGRGTAIAHVAELPGCFAEGSSAPKAVQATPGAITRYLQWLKAHREPLVPEAHISRPSMADLFVADVLRAPAHRAPNRAVLFEFDKEPWSDEKLERTLRWLGYSRADLLARAGDMSDAVLKSKQVAPGRTLWDVLWHVADVEYSYIESVTGPLTGIENLTSAEPADVRERLNSAREILVRRSLAVPAERRNEIIYPTWTRYPNEPWTLAQALRLALEHERSET